MVEDEVWHHNAVWYGSLWLVGLQGMVLLLIWTLGMVWHDFLYLTRLQRMTFRTYVDFKGSISGHILSEDMSSQIL